MAANPEKGEFGIVINGKEYILVMTFNGLIDLQSLFAKDGRRPTVEEILKMATEGDFEAVRAVFWSTLRRHHKHLTVEQVGDLIDEAGGASEVDSLIQRAYGASAPDPRDVTALGGAAANPPKAAKKRRGIGARLS